MPARGAPAAVVALVLLGGLLPGCGRAPAPAARSSVPPGSVSAPSGAGGPTHPQHPKHPAGTIRLHVYDERGRRLTWAQFRRRQSNGHGAAGVNDMLLDADTLQVLRGRPVQSAGRDVVLQRPAGAVALSLAWPSPAGYSTVILDLPAPGTYDFTVLIARQAVTDVAAQLAARRDYRPGPGFRASWATARAELAAAEQAGSGGAKAVHAGRGYDAAVSAALALLREYGVQRAGDDPGRGRPLWGFTLDSVADLGAQLASIRAAMGGDAGAAAVRIVFDRDVPAARYRPAVAAARRAGLQVVGELLDSSELAALSRRQWRARVADYVDTLPGVDVWEVGNEINGTWLGQDVVEKVAAATTYVRRHSRARTLVTLYWQLGEDDPQHSLFSWAARLPAATLRAVDEIGLSVYPEEHPLGAAFDRVVTTLHAAFPGQTLAVTELGYGSPDLDRIWWWGSPDDPQGSARDDVADLYTRAILGYPYSAGGPYWWYFRTEAPRGGRLWQVLARTHADVAAARRVRESR